VQTGIELQTVPACGEGAAQLGPGSAKGSLRVTSKTIPAPEANAERRFLSEIELANSLCSAPINSSPSESVVQNDRVRGEKVSLMP
jgi:hypothetical protein